jgi:hypothetical protein
MPVARPDHFWQDWTVARLVVADCGLASAAGRDAHLPVALRSGPGRIRVDSESDGLRLRIQSRWMAALSSWRPMARVASAAAAAADRRRPGTRSTPMAPSRPGPADQPEVRTASAGSVARRRLASWRPIDSGLTSAAGPGRDTHHPVVARRRPGRIRIMIDSDMDGSSPRQWCQCRTGPDQDSDLDGSSPPSRGGRLRRIVSRLGA